jgi:hypothetical protein
MYFISKLIKICAGVFILSLSLSIMLRMCVVLPVKLSSTIVERSDLSIEKVTY